jgi:hypothetical protein
MQAIALRWQGVSDGLLVSQKGNGRLASAPVLLQLYVGFGSTLHHRSRFVPGLGVRSPLVLSSAHLGVNVDALGGRKIEFDFK